MSQWTHVAGCIRYDAFAEDLPAKKILGKPFGFNDYPDNPEDRGIPYGSEGSIQYSVYTNPDESCLARHTVSIWGDLRNFGVEDVDSIRNWFEKATSAEATLLLVRDAILEINIEFKNEMIVLVYTDSGIKELVVPYTPAD